MKELIDSCLVAKQNLEKSISNDLKEKFEFKIAEVKKCFEVHTLVGNKANDLFKTIDTSVNEVKDLGL